VSCRYDSPLPFSGCVGSEFPQGGSGHEMALNIEGIVDSGMHAEEALSRIELI
jgi:hypothetical protein